MIAAKHRTREREKPAREDSNLKRYKLDPRRKVLIMKHAPLILLFIFLLALQSIIFAQQPSPQSTARPQITPSAVASPSPSAEQDDEVVRITTNLVQVDAVVTDREGRQVTDLRAEDFEILENGRPQTITNFSYIELAPGGQPVSSPVRRQGDAERNAPLVPPVRLRPEQVRRTFALVVDDLSLSFESAHFVRQALRRFVDEQMQAGDLVAIIRTGAGIGALQQFTSDRRQLYAAIERVRWNPRGRGGISAFAAIENDPLSTTREALREGSDDERSAGDALDDFREEIFSVGTLGALNFIVRGLRELPGRKAVVLFSDGISIINREGRSERVVEALRRLTDLANRASVVFYTIDARGLQTLGLTAADNTSGMTAQDIEQRLSDRRTTFFESQSGLNYLAQQTGGFAVRNSNDISGGIRRVLEDQTGYYLIGYRPADTTFDPVTGRRRFNRFQIRLKRPGLRVRTRGGFYGVAEAEARPVRRTRFEQLAAALFSPFATGDVQLRLTSVFGNDAQTGSFVRSVIHIDARNLTFVPEADGWHRTVVDVVVITFSDNGRVFDEVNRTETIRVRNEAYTAALQNGFVYPLNVPVRQPGAYQLRVAVRDSASERTGSANQYVEVPNLRRNRLTLSGLVVAGIAPSRASATSPSAAPTSSPQTTDATMEAMNAQASIAVRRFRAGMYLDYGYEIYNARLDRATRRPQLTTQVRLFRNGQQIFAGQPQPFNASAQTDMERLPVTGRLLLGSEMTPGEYVLQVIVTDALVQNERHRTATQWIDFEIVR